LARADDTIRTFNNNGRRQVGLECPAGVRRSFEPLGAGERVILGPMVKIMFVFGERGEQAPTDRLVADPADENKVRL
jgi:hypothetical protein